ncbi:MAG: TVP38/TMEM64 family protein [Chloroflexota bacterium]
MLSRLIEWIKSHRLRLVIVFLWCIGLIIVRQLMLENDLNIIDVARALEELLTAWYGPLLYILVYMLRPVLLLPASPLSVLAGSVYGIVFGVLYGLIAGTLSAVVPYAAGRWLRGPSMQSRDAVGELVPGSNKSLMQKTFDRVKQRPFQAVLLMRLLYLPYDTVSFIVGVMRTAWLPFIAATAIGNIPGTLAFVGIGASLEGDITRGDLSLDPVVFAFSLLVFVISIAVSRLLRDPVRDNSEPVNFSRYKKGETHYE